MTMRSKDPQKKLERVNLMLAPGDRAWMERLSAEIAESTGAKVSASEIVRAGVATLKAIHRMGGAAPCGNLAECRDAEALEFVGVLMVRRAANNSRLSVDAAA
jgi:hypothetical protein